jgi:hypothetical protein
MTLTKKHGGSRVLEVRKHVWGEAPHRVQVPRQDEQNGHCRQREERKVVEVEEMKG